MAQAEDNEENWKWFLDHCSSALPFMNDAENSCVVMTKDVSQLRLMMRLNVRCFTTYSTLLYTCIVEHVSFSCIPFHSHFQHVYNITHTFAINTHKFAIKTHTHLRLKHTHTFAIKTHTHLRLKHTHICDCLSFFIFNCVLLQEESNMVMTLIEERFPNASPAVCAQTIIDILRQKRYMSGAPQLFRDMLHAENEVPYLPLSHLFSYNHLFS